MDETSSVGRFLELNDDRHGTLLRFVCAQATADSTDHGEPVLLVHGAFSNRATCWPLANHLAICSRAVHVVEWRRRDIGPGNTANFGFEDLAHGEVANAVRRVYSLHGDRPVHVVGHSAGGIAVAMLLAQDASIRPLVASACLVGSRAHPGGRRDPRLAASLALMVALGRLIGYCPASVARLGPCNEPTNLMRQWAHLVAPGRRSRPGEPDFRAALSDVLVPVLAVSGDGDRLVAPTHTCEALVDAFGGRRDHIRCGLGTDHEEDFTHSRLWRSRAAARSVWPLIDTWVGEHTKSGGTMNGPAASLE